MHISHHLSIAVLSMIVSAGLSTLGCDAPQDEDVPDEGFQGEPRVRIFVDEDPVDPDNVEQDLDVVRYGDPLHVIIDGLEPGSTLDVETLGGPGRSAARFTVPEDGVVDFSRDAPTDGSWEGVEPEGFVWSMTGEPSPELDLSLTVHAIIDGERAASDVVQRRPIIEGVIQEDVAESPIVGQLCIPDPDVFGDGPFPGVLVFGGSEGGSGTGIYRANYLASLGYAALGVAYFGEEGVPEFLDLVPLENLEADLAFLAADPRVDPSRIGVWGGSRGGELALLLGAHLPIVKAVVAGVPSGYVWAANAVGGRSAWTLDGEPLPFLRTTGTLPETTVDDAGDPHYSYRRIFVAAVEEATEEERLAATIPIENTSAPVFMQSGEDDALWPSCLLADVAWQRLVERGLSALDANHCYPGAGHIIGVPGWSSAGAVEIFNAETGTYMVLGGDVPGNGRTARLADTDLRAFLQNAL